MTPYEALYARRCKTPLCCYYDENIVLIWPSCYNRQWRRFDTYKNM